MTTPVKLPPPQCRCETCIYASGEPSGQCRREPWGGLDEAGGRAQTSSWCGRWLGLRRQGHRVVLLNYPTACELWANGDLPEEEAK